MSRHPDRARVAAATVTGSMSNLVTAEARLAEEIAIRLKRGTSIDQLADHLRLPPQAVEGLAELYTSGRAGERWGLPILPAILATHRHQETDNSGSPQALDD